jgi:hypothetical protein
MKQELKKYIVEFSYTTYHEVDNVEAVSPQGALELLNDKLWDSEKEEDVKKFLDETIVDDDPEYQHSSEAKVLQWDDPEEEYMYHGQKPNLVAVQRSWLADKKDFNCELPFSESKLLLDFLKEQLGPLDSQGDDWYEGGVNMYYDWYKEKDKDKQAVKLMYNIIKSYREDSTLTEDREHTKNMEACLSYAEED